MAVLKYKDWWDFEMHFAMMVKKKGTTGCVFSF
jgi:hypothetical protein